MATNLYQLPAVFNHTVFLGDDYALNISINQDITDMTFTAKYGNLSITPTVVNASTGSIKLLFTSANSNAMGVGKYEWNLDMTSDGLTRTILAGSFAIVNKGI
jgi:hypothetical protein